MKLKKIPLMTLDRLTSYKKRPRSWEYREKNAVSGGQGAGFEPAAIPDKNS